MGESAVCSTQGDAGLEEEEGCLLAEVVLCRERREECVSPPSESCLGRSLVNKSQKALNESTDE